MCTPVLATLVAPLQERLGVVVADSGYFAARFLQVIYERFSVLVTTPCLCLFKIGQRMSHFKQYYNDMAGSWAGKITYRRRKPSIEPTFALIKELTGLTGNTMLPYKGLDRGSAYLMIASCTIQLIQT